MGINFGVQASPRFGVSIYMQQLQNFGVERLMTDALAQNSTGSKYYSGTDILRQLKAMGAANTTQLAGAMDVKNQHAFNELMLAFKRNQCVSQGQQGWQLTPQGEAALRTYGG